MRAAKVQASLRIRAVSPEPPLLAHTSSESRGTFRQKARSLTPLNGWACAVKICHDGMLEDTNSLDGAQLIIKVTRVSKSPLMMGMERLSPIDEYYIQLSYFSLIAIFQKTDFMHIQACREQCLFNNNVFLPILCSYQNLGLYIHLS